jgi:peptidoglycan/LPS O-acetylase OafA/YrhL
VVFGYYRRRALRMLPSYYATLAFVRLAFLRLQGARWGAPEAKRAVYTLWFNAQDGCPDALWANWVFANNQLPRAGCMKYAWSQAVQVLLATPAPSTSGLAAMRGHGWHA